MPVRLDSVGVTFGDRPLLRRLDLEVGRGELLALMGPSGSGKTTLLSVLAGLRTPDEGARVVVGDAPPSVAWVFQTSPVLMRRTALENVALGPRLAGAGRATSVAQAGEALARLAIHHLGAQPLYRLSGGERQRVVIARALASRASLVIADEPTASLDGQAKHVVVEALAELSVTGASVVVATHDRSVASRCARIEVLAEGRLRSVAVEADVDE